MHFYDFIVKLVIFLQNSLKKIRFSGFVFILLIVRIGFICVLIFSFQGSRCLSYSF